MKKGISATKLKVIIALNFVVIALLLGLFFFMQEDKGTLVNATPTPHSRVRTAQISLNPQLSWELSLSGSGDELAVASFLNGEFLYIFGNTTSRDLDFDREGIFLAIIDTYGITKAFFVYGESGDSLKAATLCEGGFLLAVEGASAVKVMVVDFDGKVIKTLSSFFSGLEEIASIKYFSGGYFMLSQPKNLLTGVRSLRCSYFRYDGGVIFSSSSVATSPYSLDPVDTAVISGKVVAICSASSTLHTVPAIVEFAQNDSPKIKLFTDYPGSVAGFSVHDGDFLLLTRQDGATFLKINTLYAVKQKTSLGQLAALAIGEIEESQLYLVFVESAVYITTAAGERKYTLPAFRPAVTPFGAAYLNGAMIYAGSMGGTSSTGSVGSVAVNIYNSKKVLFSATIGDGSNPMLAIDENNLFCIYHNSGDVIITKLRYPLF